ncbi:MAG: DUF1993 domain-containing protein [Chromatiales bacterium]|jgi:hypothetical protein|nr:MAG: DUF1993 domain-containing protein [Chromatiales bacterium]
MTVAISSIARTATDQMYAGLDGVLLKGTAHAKARHVDEAVFLNWRLAPDMFPLIRQVQFATEIPARGLSRLAGVEVPSFPDIETTFEELRERVARARAHINDLPSVPMDAEPHKEIKVPMGKEERSFTRINLLQHFILPNLYFHTTTAYLILRHLGVDIGKLDFLAAPPR